jgi:hypothetical protein
LHDDFDAGGSGFLVGELLGLDGAVTGNDLVAERARDILAIGRHQRDIQRRIELPQRAGATGAAEAAADHNDLRAGDCARLGDASARDAVAAAAAAKKLPS